MNKYKLNFEEARYVADKYVDYLEDVVAKIIAENSDNIEKIEITLMEIANGTEVEDAYLKEANRLLGEGQFQVFANQKLIEYTYKEFKTKVLPGNDFRPVYKYLDNMSENQFIEIITSEIDKYKGIIYDLYDVLGYRKEYKVENDGCSNYENTEIIVSLKHNEKYFELSIFEDFEDTGCGTNSYGHAVFERVVKPNITAKIKKPMKIQLPKESYDVELLKMTPKDTPICVLTQGELKIDDLLEVSYNDGDIYYPLGYVIFNYDKFEEPNIRQFNSRPVWIFKGDSGAGKSYLASLLERIKLTVFETDSLPSSNLNTIDVITSDIIVIGNRYDISVEEIKKCVFEYENVNFIEVDFTKAK